MDTIPTSSVKVGISLSTIPSKGRMLNGVDSFNWIIWREKLVGWTYNYNWSTGVLSHFDRLISCRGREDRRVRLANNTHMKCYIGKKSMLITSFNLTYPTVNDMGMEVLDVALCNYMRRMFNKHWKELE